MNVYEMAFITTDDKAALKAVEAIVTQHAGTVNQKEAWGERQFSYQINNLNKGFYHLWDVSLDGDKLSDLKTRLNLEDGVIRYLLLKID